MKKIVLLFTFIFFATQIIPVKYIGYMCNCELYVVDNNDLSDEEDAPIKLKEKVDSEFALQINLHNNYQISVLKTSRNKFPSFCCTIPDDIVITVLIPPPNC